jgi:hypothetical protein
MMTFFTPFETTHLSSSFRFLCDKLGGRLPVFENDTQRVAEYNVISRLFDEQFDNITCRLNDDDNLNGGGNDSVIFFWTGIVEDVENNKNVFVNEYDARPIEFDPKIWPGPAASDITCTTTRCRRKEPVIFFRDPSFKIHFQGIESLGQGEVRLAPPLRRL